MASFRCYDNSYVIATLIMTNFHPYLIQLRWQSFQMSVYAQTFISYASTAHVVALYGLHFILTVFKKIGQLARSFWANGLPPPPPPPPGKKLPNCPYAYEINNVKLFIRSVCEFGVSFFFLLPDLFALWLNLLFLFLVWWIRGYKSSKKVVINHCRIRLTKGNRHS